MNKQLALKQLEKSCKELARFKRYDLEIGFSDNQALNVIKQALQPPTAEEMCKALSEYLEKDVKYNNERKCFGIDFIDVEDTPDGEVETPCFEAYTWYQDKLSIRKNLPPHLITMIGKFYEGVDVNE